MIYTIIATCSDPGKPNKGFRTDNLEEFIVRTEVEFGCTINTSLIGSSKRTCQPNGRWSGEQPTCESKCKRYFEIGIVLKDRNENRHDGSVNDKERFALAN